MAIKALVWDCGNVLVSWRPADLFNQLISSPTHAAWWLKHSYASEWNALGDAGMPYAEANKVWERDFETRHSDRLAEFPKYQELIAAYGRHPEETHAFLNHDTVALRGHLAATHGCFALTNFSDENWPRVNAVHAGRLDQDFWDVVMSSRIKMIKPDAGIFSYTLQVLAHHGFKPEEALFIDDSARNVAASVRSGLPALLFTSAAQLRADLAKHGIKTDHIPQQPEWVRAAGTGLLKPIM